MDKQTLRKAISEAGGIKAVSLACGLSYEAVRKWTKKGLPRTEWNGDTSYAKVIAKMQRIYSADDLLVKNRTD